MSLNEIGVSYKQMRGYLFASVRKNVITRQQIAQLLAFISEEIPQELIAGPPFLLRYFIHSYPQGLDVEVGFPVNEPVEGEQVTTRRLPEFAVLSKTHNGGSSQLGEAYEAVFGCQDRFGLISDEFCVEVLHDHNPLEGRIEVQMVMHPWHALFGYHLERVMGEVVCDAVMEEFSIFVEMPGDQRFAWTKAAVDRLNLVSDDYQRYEVLSSCSHVYPREQAEKLRRVYQDAYSRRADMFAAVDAVLAFMKEDPGWRQKIYRDGKVVYATKNPRNPQAYARAKTELERRQAYCFCPIIRNHLEEEMSPTFCYCSAGFERKQWEVALGQSIKIDVVKSLLKGHQECQFAIHLPVDEED